MGCSLCLAILLPRHFAFNVSILIVIITSLQLTRYFSPSRCYYYLFSHQHISTTLPRSTSAMLGACGVTFHEPTGWILSPGFPGNYSTGVNCLWTVMLEDHCVINVTLRMLDLWDGDAITFKDIEGRSASGIFMLSNSALPDEGAVPFHIGVTLHNNLTVRFVSGHTSKALGFAIFYEAIAIYETRTRRTSTTGITSEPPATTRIETTRSGTTKIRTTPLTPSRSSVSFNDFTENATSILTKLTNPRTNTSPVHRLLKTPDERITPPLSLVTEQVPMEKASVHSKAQEGRGRVKSVQTGIIVGGVLGAIAFIVVIVILVWMFMWYGRRFNSRRAKRQTQNDSRPSFQLGKLSYGNAIDTSRTDLQKSSNDNFDIAEYDDPSDIKIADENSSTSWSCSKPCEGATVLTDEAKVTYMNT
ncbi:uncharacterized protein [Ptychodera flava]|uniref:uncharacterized protein n=1 Tax=Ptychodera flava TaxID=63121 RepID=UPI00396A422A